MSDSKPTGSSGSAPGATTPKAGSGGADPKTVPPTPGATVSAPAGGSSGSKPVAPAPGTSTSAPVGGSSASKPVTPAPGSSTSAPPLGGSSGPKPVPPAPGSTASAPPAAGSSGPKPVPSTAGTSTSAPPLGGTPKPAEPTPSSSSSAPPAGSSDPKPVPSAPGSTASASPGGSSAGSSGPKPVPPAPGFTASAPPAAGSSGPKPVPSTAGTSTSAPPLGGTPKPAEPTPSSSSSAPPAGSSDPKPVPSAPGSTASASPGGSSAGSSGPKPVAPTPGSSSPCPADSPLQIVLPSANVSNQAWKGLLGAFRDTLTKLIIKLPRVVRVEDNILHLQLSHKMYPKLETLVLDYSLYANCDDFPTERNQRLCYRQIGGLKRLIDDSSTDSKAKGIRSLTLLALPKINQVVLRNIARVFPKLVELNIQARNGLVYDTLYDEELLVMLGRLKQLRTLRFLDSYPKPDELFLSVGFMSVRANSLNAPVLVRIPIDLRKATRQFRSFMDAITEDCQWIQVL